MKIPSPALGAAVLLAGLAAAGCGRREAPAQATDSARQEVLQALERYYADFSARDWDAFSSHFWPGATLTTVWQPPGEDAARVVVTGLEDFAAQAPQGPESREIFEERMLSARARPGESGPGVGALRGALRRSRGGRRVDRRRRLHPDEARPRVEDRVARLHGRRGALSGGRARGRVLSGPQEGYSAVEDEYEVVEVSETVYSVSYLASSGYTLTVTLNFETGEMFGFASGRDRWFPGRGTFEVVR